MKGQTLFSSGEGSRNRGDVRTCPRCDSDDLLYNHRELDRDIVRCRKCRFVFSKKSRGERSQNRY